MRIKARDREEVQAAPLPQDWPYLSHLEKSGTKDRQRWGGWGSFSMPPCRDARDGQWRGACPGTELQVFCFQVLPGSLSPAASGKFPPPPLLPHIHTMLLAFQILE